MPIRKSLTLPILNMSRKYLLESNKSLKPKRSANYRACALPISRFPLKTYARRTSP